MSDTKLSQEDGSTQEQREMLYAWCHLAAADNRMVDAITGLLVDYQLAKDSHAAQTRKIEELEAKVKLYRLAGKWDTQAALERAERAEAALQLHHTTSAELVALLREHWKSPDVDSMTFLISAIVAGIAESWASNPPANGIVQQAVWPEVGPIEIQIRRMPEGKSAAQTILDLQDQLRQIKDVLPGERALEIADRPLFCKPEERYSDREALRVYAKRLEGTAEPAAQEALRPIEVGCTVRHKTDPGWGTQVVAFIGEPYASPTITDTAVFFEAGGFWRLSQLERVEPADSGSKG